MDQEGLQSSRGWLWVCRIDGLQNLTDEELTMEDKIRFLDFMIQPVRFAENQLVAQGWVSNR